MPEQNVVFVVARYKHIRIYSPLYISPGPSGAQPSAREGVKLSISRSIPISDNLRYNYNWWITSNGKDRSRKEKD